MRGFFGMILDFSQEIRDAMAYHAAGAHIAIHVQGTGGGHFLGGTKRFFQIHKPPISRHTQDQIIPIHFPKGGTRYIRRGGNG